MASVLEYLTAEVKKLIILLNLKKILELAGNAVKD